MMASDRRQFIRKTALGIGGASLLATSGRLMKADPLGIPIGLQLYTVRQKMHGGKNIESTLKTVRSIGYTLVELFATLDLPAAQWRRMLDEAGLKAPSGHWPAALLRDDPQAKVDYAKALGLSYLVCAFPTFKDPHAKGDVGRDMKLSDWEWLAGLFNQIGEECRKAGIQLCYHGHNIGFRKYDGVVAYDYLLTHTDPSLVKFEMDCFWVERAGQDPVAYFKKYPARFPLLHIKGMKGGFAPTTYLGEGAKAITEVGRGVINWKRIFEHAHEAGVKYYFVEQDFCSEPVFNAIKISYAYLHNLQV
jgi:sugar phosphate isomerase/epimerase